MVNFLIARLSAWQPCKWGTHVGFLHLNASLIFKSFSSAVEVSESPQPEQKQEANESFKVSYLIESWGLSPKAAIDAAKRCKLEEPDKVLNLFRSYGFSDTHISKIVKKYPFVLGSNPEKNLLPRLRFFESIGVSRSEFPQLLISNSRLLTWSLNERIIPGYEALKRVVDDNERTNIIRKPKGWNFLHSDVKNVIPNVKFLRELEKMTSTMKFLVDEMGLSGEDIAKFPAFVGYSLKQRIIPRCLVFKFFKTKGVINNDVTLSPFIAASEKSFLEKFVMRFQERVPEVLNIYQDQLSMVRLCPKNFP